MEDLYKKAKENVLKDEEGNFYLFENFIAYVEQVIIKALISKVETQSTMCPV